MFLRGRLQWLLLAICVVSGVIALVLARSGSQSVQVPVTTTSTVPATTTTTVYVEPIRYTVQSGDSLFAIAKLNKLDMAQLMQLNGITNPDHVEAGQVLLFPPATGFLPVAPSTTMAP